MYKCLALVTVGHLRLKLNVKKKQDEKDEERGRRGNAHHTKSNLKMTITKN